MTWDRSKQTYWIARRGDPWKVFDFKNEERLAVCEFPAYCYDAELTEQICFAPDDETVKQLCAKAFDERRNQKSSWPGQKDQADKPEQPGA